MKAIVLCAGFGTRMGPLTATVPKPMLDLGGVPLLERTVRHLGALGFDEVAVNLHYLGDSIEDHFAGRLRLLWEDAPSGTAGAVKKLESFVGDSRVLVLYGDILSDEDYRSLVDFHAAAGAALTLCVHRRAKSNSIVERDEEGRVTAFAERPPASAFEGRDSVWVNSGMYVLEPEVVAAIPSGRPWDFPRDMFPALVERGSLFARPITGYRCAIDTPQRLALARSDLAAGRVALLGQQEEETCASS